MTAVEFAVSSHVGLVRDENQDAVGNFPSDVLDDSGDLGVLFVVADGMGGHKGGKEASRIAVEVVGDTYFSDEGGSIAERLRTACKSAHAAIREYGDSHPQCKGMGTTLTALVLQNGTGYIAHVGDSRAYRLAEGEVVQLTEDHSIVAEWRRKGWITEEQARLHPERSLLYRALGVGEEVSVDVIENIVVHEGDSFLLCTDGLSNHLEKDEIQDLLLEGPPEDACRKMVSLALERGGYDNITVQIMRYGTREGTPPPPQAGA